MLFKEVENNKFIEQHAVSDATCHNFSLKSDPLVADILHQLLCVLPRQHLTCFILFGHVLKKCQKSRRQCPWLLSMLGLTEILMRLHSFFWFELVDEMPLRRRRHINRWCIGLMEGNFCIFSRWKHSSCLCEQLTLIYLCTCGHFCTLSHRLYELSHIS